MKVIGAAAVLTACSEAPQRLETIAPQPPADAATARITPLTSDPAVIAQLKADVGYLASDALMGREAGEPGYDLAADYVAERFKTLGLEAVGDGNSFYQTITFHAIQSNLAGGAVVSIAGGDEQIWEPNVDFIGASINPTAQLNDVPIIFAGYGLVSDAHQRNDYEGLDVDGKVVLLIMGAPDFLPSEEKAHFSNVQSQIASEHGAIGIIRLLSPSFEENRIPFGALAARVGQSESLRWVGANGRTHSNAPNLVGGLVMGQVGATKLFKSIGRDWQEIVHAANTGVGGGDRFETGLQVSMRFDSTIRDFQSANVIGLVPGFDPALSDELVVVSAHLDHIGVNGTSDDKIHNGAMDNAVGVAAILEAARQIAKAPTARPVLFAAVTAEEKGLLGSDYLARHNPLRSARYVAAINLDMPVVTFPFEDLVAFGA
ncbi:MAG: M28 family peptidase, partial [Pseudomonadota bacterium]